MALSYCLCGMRIQIDMHRCWEYKYLPNHIKDMPNDLHSCNIYIIKGIRNTCTDITY